MNLKDITFGINAKFNQHAEADAKRFANSINRGLSSIKKTEELASKKMSQRWSSMASRGLAILDMIQAKANQTLNTTKELSGYAGQFTDLSASIGSKEEELIGASRAFGLAGVGDSSILYNMLERFQQAVVSEKVDIGDRDVLSAFLDLLQELKQRTKEQQDALLLELGFGRNNVEMKKLINASPVAMKELAKQENISKAQHQAKGVRNFGDLGDRLAFLEEEQKRDMISIYETKNIYKDIEHAQAKAHNFQTNKAHNYTEGEAERGMQTHLAIENVQDHIPELAKALFSIFQPLKEEEKKYWDFKVAKIQEPEFITVLNRTLRTVNDTAVGLKNQFTMIFDNKNDREEF